LKTWSNVDPRSEYSDFWNRGASYVTFSWGAAGSVASVANPSPDIIMVTIDPCGLEAKKLDLLWIIASSELKGSCLKLSYDGLWMESGKKIYKLEH
jgi:hypothetical protein